MYIKKEKFISAFAEIEDVLTNYSLPSWDALPDIDLYMDQVVSVVTKYLDVPRTAIGVTRSITPAMINNYVKLGIIPPPKKKK
ncbi:MAG: DUF1836 domain-containing protein [Clostridia bacterium]|nr:DUF1836 domain-containing protein [Clostridia bacterium]